MRFALAAMPPSGEDTVYGVAMPPPQEEEEEEEEEEEVAPHFDPPSWAKLPTGHPDIRLEETHPPTHPPTAMPACLPACLLLFALT